MSKDKRDNRDKEFKIPIQYSMQQPLVQVEFPEEITTRESSLHLSPGSVRFVGEKELEYLKKNMAGSFKTMAVKKIEKKSSRSAPKPPQPPLESQPVKVGEKPVIEDKSAGKSESSKKKDKK